MPSAVWAAELTMLEETLLEQLNERLRRERQVRALKFTAAPASSRLAEASGAASRVFPILMGNLSVSGVLIRESICYHSKLTWVPCKRAQIAF